MDIMIAFFGGMFLGGVFGFFFLALILAAKREDEMLERFEWGDGDGEDDKA